MLNDLKFVQGAVAKKDYVSALQYFRIQDGRIEGFNGQLAISTPTDLQVTAFPKAVSFVKAIEKVPDGAEVALNLTQAGRLSVKAGNFRAYVECLPDDGSYPAIAPEGAEIRLPGGVLPVLRTLAPFMAIDASRPWAMGILFRGNSAFATNNLVLVEYWVQQGFPIPLCIPSDAVKEMLRIGVEPTHMQYTERAVTFHYPSGAWLRTGTGSLEWPDLTKVLDRTHNGLTPLPTPFFDALETLDPFAEKSRYVYLMGETLGTSNAEGVGALVDVPGFDGAGIFNLDQLALLKGVAQSIDWSGWPGPCLFFGNMTRGAIVGYRG